MRRRKPNVFRDAELTQLLRDEPELLPIADAIVATQHALWRRKRIRRVAPLLAAGAVLTGGFAVFSFAALTGSDGGIVEEALAAVPGEGPVTHVLARRAVPGTGLIHLESGREAPEVVELELWFDAERKLLRTLVRRNNTVVTDILQESQAGLPVAKGVDPTAPRLSDTAVAVFAMDYRAALRSGRATPVRTRADASGIPALVVRSLFGTQQRVTLDRQRLRPVRIRSISADGRARGPAWNVDTAEVLSRRTSFFNPKRKTPSPSSGRVVASRSIPLADARVALGKPAAWSGPSVHTLPLRKVSLETLTRKSSDAATRPARSRGLELLYGDVQRGRPNRQGSFLQIQQAASPEPAYGYLQGSAMVEPPPPPGHVRLERRGRLWSGKVVRRGLYITLAGSDRATLLAGARSLRPIPEP